MSVTNATKASRPPPKPPLKPPPKPPPCGVELSLQASLRSILHGSNSDVTCTQDKSLTEDVSKFFANPTSDDLPRGFKRENYGHIENTFSGKHTSMLPVSLMTKKKKPIAAAYVSDTSDPTDKTPGTLVLIIRGSRHKQSESTYVSLDSFVVQAILDMVYITHPRTPCNFHPWFSSILVSFAAEQERLCRSGVLNQWNIESLDANVASLSGSMKAAVTRAILEGRVVVNVCKPCPAITETMLHNLAIDKSIDSTTKIEISEHTTKWLQFCHSKHPFLYSNYQSNPTAKDNQQAIDQTPQNSTDDVNIQLYANAVHTFFKQMSDRIVQLENCSNVEDVDTSKDSQAPVHALPPVCAPDPAPELPFKNRLTGERMTLQEVLQHPKVSAKEKQRYIDYYYTEPSTGASSEALPGSPSSKRKAETGDSTSDTAVVAKKGRVDEPKRDSSGALPGSPSSKRKAETNESTSDTAVVAKKGRVDEPKRGTNGVFNSSLSSMKALPTQPTKPTESTQPVKPKLPKQPKQPKQSQHPAVSDDVAIERATEGVTEGATEGDNAMSTVVDKNAIGHAKTDDVRKAKATKETDCAMTSQKDDKDGNEDGNEDSGVSLPANTVEKTKPGKSNKNAQNSESESESESGSESESESEMDLDSEDNSESEESSDDEEEDSTSDESEDIDESSSDDDAETDNDEPMRLSYDNAVNPKQALAVEDDKKKKKPNMTQSTLELYHFEYVDSYIAFRDERQMHKAVNQEQDCKGIQRGSHGKVQ